MDTEAEAGTSSDSVGPAASYAPVTLTEEDRKRYLRWAMGDKDAYDLLIAWVDLLQVPDDLVDNDRAGTTDKPVRSALTTRLMHTMTVVLPTNPLYAQHQHCFAPLQTVILTNWHIANLWEGSPELEKRIFAYVYRTLAIEFVTLTAYIIGGWGHAIAVTEEALELAARGDKFKEWEDEEK